MQDCATRRGTAVLLRIMIAAMLKGHTEVCRYEITLGDDSSHLGGGGFHMDMALTTNRRN